jgi:transketolase
MPSEPLDKKYEAFGWHVIKIDGHDYNAIINAFREAETVKGKPTVILAKTVKGKGISYMENNAGWHGKAPSAEEYAQGKAELTAILNELEEA